MTWRGAADPAPFLDRGRVLIAHTGGDRLEELQAWASKKGYTVDECPTCKPYK